MPNFMDALRSSLGSIGPSQNFGMQQGPPAMQRQQLGPNPLGGMNRPSIMSDDPSRGGISGQGGVGPSQNFLQTLLASLMAARGGGGGGGGQSNYAGPQGMASIQARPRPPGAPTVGQAVPRPPDMNNPNMFNAIQAGRMQSIQNQPWRDTGSIIGHGPEPADDSQGNVGAPIYGPPIYPNLSTGVGPANYRLGPGYGTNYGQ